MKQPQSLSLSSRLQVRHTSCPLAAASTISLYSVGKKEARSSGELHVPSPKVVLSRPDQTAPAVTAPTRYAHKSETLSGLSLLECEFVFQDVRDVNNQSYREEDMQMENYITK